MAVTIKEGSRHCFVTKYVGNGGGQRVGNFIPYTDNGTIAKSCMFDDGSTNYLTRTQGSGSVIKKERQLFHGGSKEDLEDLVQRYVCLELHLVQNLWPDLTLLIELH